MKKLYYQRHIQPTFQILPTLSIQMIYFFPKSLKKKYFKPVNICDWTKHPDQIKSLTSFLKVIIPQMSSHLDQIFNDSLSIGYYPAHFKKFIIIILRKERGNKDLISPKNYRPISLLNTVGKIMEAVLAARISYMATTHNFVSKRTLKAGVDHT